jgi:[ribosomal protein S5]-alanine N-acetyltransferase
MAHVPVLEGQRLRLRPLRESDKAERLALGRDAEYVRFNGGDPARAGEFTADDAERWFASFAGSLRWGIEHDGRLIGEARLDQPDAIERSARFAIGLYTSTHWGQGLGTEATRLVLRHAFESMQLRRVELRVLAFNERAIRCYEKCGFVRGGYERTEVLVAGEWHRDVRMAVTDEIYRLASRKWVGA